MSKLLVIVIKLICNKINGMHLLNYLLSAVNKAMVRVSSNQEVMKIQMKGDKSATVI